MKKSESSNQGKTGWLQDFRSWAAEALGDSIKVVGYTGTEGLTVDLSDGKKIYFFADGVAMIENSIETDGRVLKLLPGDIPDEDSPLKADEPGLQV